MLPVVISTDTRHCLLYICPLLVTVLLEFGSCVKVEVAVLGSLFLVVRTVSVDTKEQ